MKNDLVVAQLKKFKPCSDAACNFSNDKTKFQKYGLESTCTSNEFTIFYILIANHVIQLFISLTCVGSKMLHHAAGREAFIKGFWIVATVFAIMDIVCLAVCIPIAKSQ